MYERDCCFHNPSIHFLPLIQGRIAMAAGWPRESSHPSNVEVFTSLMRYIFSSACSGFSLGSQNSWIHLKKLQKEAPNRHPDQMPEPPQLPPSDAGAVPPKNPTIVKCSLFYDLDQVHIALPRFVVKQSFGVSFPASWYKLSCGG